MIIIDGAISFITRYHGESNQQRFSTPRQFITNEIDWRRVSRLSRLSDEFRGRSNVENLKDLAEEF